VDRSKKGTSGKRLPSHSNVTPEEVKRSLKSTVDEMLEAGDIASSNPLRTVKPTCADSHLAPLARQAIFDSTGETIGSKKLKYGRFVFIALRLA
jgi:hypothetical protein